MKIVKAIGGTHCIYYTYTAGWGTDTHRVREHTQTHTRTYVILAGSRKTAGRMYACVCKRAGYTLYQRVLVSIGFLCRTHRRGCCGKEGFNDSRSCVDLRPLKHIECALYVCKLGQALRPSALRSVACGNPPPPTLGLTFASSVVRRYTVRVKLTEPPSEITTFWSARPCAAKRIKTQVRIRALISFVETRAAYRRHVGPRNHRCISWVFSLRREMRLS